ncbi:hypothetical protein ABT026_10215 [Streptomyces sp. NPDC002734]|uniref:hypothetical protein n=1 Tax=Streptomyces sp. NPDC002734 TaxID=3154426 RepID=UPI0033348A23
MCKRMLLSALAVAFSAGALLGNADGGGQGVDGSTSVQADWVWMDSVEAHPAYEAEAGVRA